MEKAEEKRQAWLKKHDYSAPNSTLFDGETEEEKEWGRKLAEEFKRDYAQSKQVVYANGVLGEREPHFLFRKNLIWDEGGVHMQFYGVNYVLHGNPTERQVHGLEMAKSNLFQMPLVIVKYPFLLLGLGLTYVFSRKKLLNLIYRELWEIHWKTTRHYDPKPEEYTRFGRELRRASREALMAVFGIDNEKPYFPPGHPEHQKNMAYPGGRPDNNHLGWVIALFVRFVRTFLELDFAYRFRIQDILAEKRGSTTKEVFRLLNLLITRETKYLVTKNGEEVLVSNANALKWRVFRGIIRVVFLLEPRVKQFVLVLLSEIDVDKVRMDENDWYFCLGWISFNYRGLTYEERMKIRRELDLKNKHAYWKLWNYAL